MKLALARSNRAPMARTALIVPLLAVLSPARLAAAPPQVEVLGRLSLEQRTKPPTFYQGSSLRLMNRGALLYLGKGMWREQEVFHLLRLSDLRQLTVRAPLAAYLDKYPEVLPKAARPTHEHFSVERLLFYDRESGAAAFEASDNSATRAVARHFYLHWDLARNEVTEATLVARTRSRASYASPISIGYDPARKTYYYVRDVVPTDGKRKRRVTVVGFVVGKPKVIAQFDADAQLSRRAFFDLPRRRALLVEYAERGMGVTPRGHLVGLDDGSVRSFEIPLVTYGAAFSADGATIYLYSAQTGMLWAVEAASGRMRKRVKVGGLGHELGRLTGGQLIVLRNAGFQLLRERDLRRERLIPITRLYPGFSHVQGSRVLPDGRMALKNGNDLYVVRLRAARRR